MTASAAATFHLTDTTGIAVTLTGVTRDDALDQAHALAGALRRRIDVTPAVALHVAPRVRITGWSAYPVDAPARFHAA